MRSIVVSPKNKEEFEFLSQMLKKMNISSKVITEEDMEDLGLSVLMKQADRSDIVSEEEVEYKLKKR